MENTELKLDRDEKLLLKEMLKNIQTLKYKTGVDSGISLAMRLSVPEQLTLNSLTRKLSRTWMQ